MSFRQDSSFCFSPSQRKTKTEVSLRSSCLGGENRVEKAPYPYLLRYYVEGQSTANNRMENGWEFTFSSLSYKLTVAFFVGTSFYLRV